MAIATIQCVEANQEWSTREYPMAVAPICPPCQAWSNQKAKGRDHTTV